MESHGNGISSRVAKRGTNMNPTPKVGFAEPKKETRGFRLVVVVGVSKPKISTCLYFNFYKFKLLLPTICLANKIIVTAFCSNNFIVLTNMSASVCVCAQFMLRPVSAHPV